MPQNGVPYGDIYTAGTPFTDRVVAQLQMEQKQRDVGRKQQMAAMDAEGQKLYGDLRNEEDAKDVLGSWNQYKGLKMSLMRMNPNDPNYLKTQASANKAYADAIGTARASKQAAEDEKSMRDNMEKNPYDYNENAFDLLSTRRKTGVRKLSSYETVDPKTGQKQVIDLSNPDVYRSQFPDIKLDALDKEAAGTPLDYWQKPVSVSPIQQEQRSYKFGNTPEQYYQRTVNGLANEKGIRAAGMLWSKINPDVVQGTQKQYDAVPLDKWKLIGLDKPQDLTINENDAPTVKLAKHKAQLYWLSNEPKQGETKRVTDEYKKNLLDNEQAKEMAGIHFGYSKQLQDNALDNQKELARWKKEKGLTDGKDEDAWADNYLDNLPTKEGTATYKTADGKTTKEKEIQADAVLLKSLSRSVDGHSDEPDRVYYNEDTKQYRPIFYEKKWNGTSLVPVEKGGMASVRKDLSQPISRDQMKLALGVKTMSKKQLAATMSSDEKPAQSGGGSWKSRAKKVN